MTSLNNSLKDKKHDKVEYPQPGYLNLEVLTNIEDSNLGLHNGPTSVAASACADDIILLSRSSTDLQTMLDIAAHDATQKIYHFSTSKTTTMVLNS